ncbi:hypothetical protein [Kitasatospora sp. NPDC087315]|uniref:hypothetical protein n=1 Tax=Kitasatospora sp. NPDC087315 TaxID=3364069 RepID=UPI003811FE3B
MTRRNTPTDPLYVPQLGEIVKDMAHRGVHGAYMGTESGKVYLRPEHGGIEWTTYPSEIQPLVRPMDSKPATSRGKPPGRLPEPSAGDAA